MKLLKLLNDNLERYLMLVLLLGMTLVLGIQIVFRFVLNSPLTWSEELARFMFIWSTFLSIGFCLREGISLKIDTLISLFPKKTQAVIYMAGDVVMAVFFIYLLPASWEFAYTSVLSGQTSAACHIPMYFIQISLMVGLCPGRLPLHPKRLEQPSIPAPRRRSSRRTTRRKSLIPLT